MRQAATAEAALWRGMSRAELDAAYDNTNAVRDSAAHLAAWTQRSAALRARHPEHLDLPYGRRERNRIDVFRCGIEHAPIFVFLHGGYWQRNSKEIFCCMAEGPLAHGFDVAVPGYTLAPTASLTQIVGEIRAAISWLRLQGPSIGIATDKMIVSGWSAGGHLAATAMAWPEIDGGLSISGVFDLEPIRLGVLNDKLRLTPEEAAALSPIAHMPAKAGPLIVSYGGGELPELQRQSETYGIDWRQAGLDGTTLRLPGHNHFSILEELATPEGRLATTLAAEFL
jgi:acetyl esterase/lipase